MTFDPIAWTALMEQLAAMEPDRPRGWFRWLHNSYFSRYPAEMIPPFREDWREVERVVISEPERLDGPLLSQVEAHAWEIACLGLHRLAGLCWEGLSAAAKGRMLAGFSNFRDAGGYIRSRLPEATLSAEGVLEMACNAVWREDLDLFEAALDRGCLSEEVERWEPFGRGSSREGRWAEDVARLSDRVVDMALEACVLRGWGVGARLALRLGADPDLHVWALERNYNEHHSALSYSIKEGNGDVVEALFEAGVRPADESVSWTLYRAIANGDDAMAARLLENGADFERGDNPKWLAASRPGDNIEWGNAMRLGYYCESIEEARRLGEGLPLVHASEATWFFRGNGQGGRYTTILSDLLRGGDAVDRLRWYVEAGLPLKVTLPDFATLLSANAYDCLRWMMDRWETPPGVMERIQRERPAFGAGR